MVYLNNPYTRADGTYIYDEGNEVPQLDIGLLNADRCLPFQSRFTKLI